MAFEIARLITLLAVATGSAWLIVRYRSFGALISFFVGWGILLFVYRAWPAPPLIWDEDGEEVYYTAPVIMMIWCLLVWSIVLARRRGNTHDGVTQ